MGESTFTVYKLKDVKWMLVSYKGKFVQKCFLFCKYILTLADCTL